MTAKKLTPKQERFVEEYLIDLNATQAYLRAGYKVKETSARVQACRLLADPNIASAIEHGKAARSERTHITQDRVLQELARIAFFDIRRLYNAQGGMKAPHELDDDAAAVLAGVDVAEEFEGSGEARVHVGHTKKAKVFDKGMALTLAMKHLGMLKEKVEHTGKDGKDLPSASVPLGVLIVPGMMADTSAWSEAAQKASFKGE